jgi:hypothetical protein
MARERFPAFTGPSSKRARVASRDKMALRGHAQSVPKRPRSGARKERPNVPAGPTFPCTSAASRHSVADPTRAPENPLGGSSPLARMLGGLILASSSGETRQTQQWFREESALCGN